MRARVPTLPAPPQTSPAIDWRHRAACRDEDPELFFPVAESDPAAYAPAILVCTRCPARAECLEWALKTGQEWGMWGGTTPMTRREIRRAIRRHRTGDTAEARRVAAQQRVWRAASDLAAQIAEKGRTDG